MNANHKQSRRHFLKQSGALSALGVTGGSWLLNLAAMGDAAAATGGGYKALVCVFLYGGNDACNTVLPLDAASWQRYSDVRDIPANVSGPLVDLRLDPATIRRVNATVDGSPVQYGLHPSLANVESLYNNKKLAVVANVGTLVKAPMRRDDLGAADAAGQLPPKLRSHNDQQVEWQSGRTNIEDRGWGGRTSDPNVFAFTPADASDKANSFRSVYLGDSATFAYGDSVVPYGLTASGNGVVPLLPTAGGKLFNGVPVKTLTDLIKGVTGGTRSNLIEKDYMQLVSRALDSESYLSTKLSAIPLNDVPVPANNGLAQQLKIVARVIKAHSGRPGRQVFFVSMGGFDTHDNQRNPAQYGNHDNLLKLLDDALGYFATALGDADMANVTTFTASDFGRLLNSNGDGTDHAWGSHHFVMGGAVDGGKFFGRMPSYAYSNGSYTDQQMTNDGAMIPVVSVGSYGATLARWFGVSDTEARTIFPNLYAQGGVSPTNVGFIKGLAG